MQLLLWILLIMQLVKSLFPWAIGCFVALLFFGSAPQLFIYYPLPSWEIFFTLIIGVAFWIRKELYPLIFGK